MGNPYTSSPSARIVPKLFVDTHHPASFSPGHLGSPAQQWFGSFMGNRNDDIALFVSFST